MLLNLRMLYLLFSRSWFGAGNAVEAAGMTSAKCGDTPRFALRPVCLCSRVHELPGLDEVAPTIQALTHCIALVFDE